MTLTLVLVIMTVANIATNRLPRAYYVPICLLGTVALLLVAWWAGLSAADLGLGRSTLISGLLWAALCVTAVVVIYSTVAVPPRTRVFFADRRAMDAPGTEIARRTLVDIPLGTVLLEEVAFRGVLLAVAIIESGVAGAIALTSLLFGLWHILPALPMHESHEVVGSALGPGVAGRVRTVAITVLVTALGGVVFALLRVWTGSLLPPIGLHWALNGMGVALAWWLAQRRS